MTRFELQAVSPEPGDPELRSDPVGLDPFVDAQGEKFFFVTQALRQRIELVRHLLEFGRQIVVLTGVTGSGKSALLDRISDPGQKIWRILRYIAGPTLNSSALLGKIAADLGIEGSDSSDEFLLESIRTCIQTAHQRGETIVMTIDDAHRLPADTTAWIALLAHCVDEASELKIVLSADAAQSALVDQLQRDSSLRALVHVVEVPRLTDEQVSAMLTHRWIAAYSTDKMPLDAAAMAQISQTSGGIPGKAIVLARQVQILAKRAKPQSHDPAQRYVIGGIALIVLFILFAFFNVDDTDRTQETQITLPREPNTPTPASLPEAPDNVSSALDTDPVGSSSGSDDPAITVHDSFPSLPTLDLPAPLTAPIANELVPAATPASPTVQRNPSGAASGALPLIANDEPADPVERQLEVPTVSSVSPSATDSSPVIRNKDPAPPYSIDWLRTRSAGGYVLQLFGVRDRLVAATFITDRKIGDKSAVLITQHAGAPWYVVVYGYYADRSSAQAAIKDLPPNLRAMEPWARPIASLN